ncbi:MAG TPA: D-alanyl-D-alanine carboxypeptidase/D-alanyl-D-alanine-endopeptidase [Gemmatimonadales bacterium]|nr:D-alanyl-D-alanine carboxypeptidase/D-alanyl-D-alanine-endopeptidase [Gemmatimonadales bacterium]
MSVRRAVRHAAFALPGIGGPLAALLLAGCAVRSAPPPLAPQVAALAAEVDGVLADPAFARASWGVAIQSLDNGQVLYRRDAERLFLPASNLKLLTAAAALVRLGADFQYRTPVIARGTRRADTLVGDLVVVGRGDPALAVDATSGADPLTPLRPWADSLRQRGIRVVQGRLLGDASLFTDPPLGPGWAWDDLDADYAAPVSALQLNESVAWIQATPGAAAGQPVAAALLPPSAPLRLFDAATTAPADSGVLALTWSRAPFGDSVALAGRISAGRPPVRLLVSVPDPARYFLAGLRAVLADAGISVLDQPTPADTVADTLFTWQSPRLDSVLVLLLKPSQNQIGETLLRTLGAQVKGVGSMDSGRAVVREVLAGFGVPPDAYVLADGSGLSRYNYVTPDAVARVLEAMYRRSEFAPFFAALPVAGVDGTLAQRLKGTRAAGNAHAKTGSLSNVRSLSGYVRTADGEMLAFVLLANGFTVPQRVVDAAADRIVERLANFSRSEDVGGR